VGFRVATVYKIFASVHNQAGWIPSANPIEGFATTNRCDVCDPDYAFLFPAIFFNQHIGLFSIVNRKIVKVQRFRGSGFKGSGFKGSEFKGSGFKSSRVQGSRVQGFRVQGFRVQGSGFRVQRCIWRKGPV
jgi:hypothetical protein